MHLNRRKILRQGLCIAQADLGGRLGGQFVDHQAVVGVVVVVQAGLVLGQDEIRFETNDVVEESSELINLASDNDVRARILL